MDFLILGVCGNSIQIIKLIQKNACILKKMNSIASEIQMSIPWNVVHSYFLSWHDAIDSNLGSINDFDFKERLKIMQIL